MKTLNIKTIVTAALIIALTCVSTMLIRIPTPSMGYIHPGDGFVLLSGFLLGPFLGAFCAGLGSALADLFAGYMIYVPATFIIKALCALVAALIMRRLTFQKNGVYRIPFIVLSGVVGEVIMVLGYFLYEAFLLGDVGMIAALEGVPFNIVQGAFGVVVASVLYPIISPIYKRAFAE